MTCSIIKAACVFVILSDCQPHTIYRGPMVSW